MKNCSTRLTHKIKGYFEASVWAERLVGMSGCVIASACLMFVMTDLAHGGPGPGDSDWPTYMHDNARSGVTPAGVDLPLTRQWVYKSPAIPKPAWSDPHEVVLGSRFETPRVKFDDVFHVAAVRNAVYFGSSVDNKVYCMDARSGKIRWIFFTGGFACIPYAIIHVFGKKPFQQLDSETGAASHDTPPEQ